MRGTLKTSTLESKFPLLRVENNCIISKFADITAAYRVTLPELFTLTGEEYEALHGAWLKALKVLPDYTVVHKQDFFIEERRFGLSAIKGMGAPAADAIVAERLKNGLYKS